MKSRIIYPKNIWYDKKFNSLSAEGKTLSIYLVTNANISLTRIYKQHDLEICFLLKLSEERLTTLKEELQETTLFYFYDEWVYINNDLSYCDYTGRDRLIDAKAAEIKNIPDKVKEVFKGLTRGNKPPINNKS